MTEATEALWSQYSVSNEINPAQRHRWRLIVQESQLKHSHRSPVVVDLGCGSGVLLSRIEAARSDARLVGLDIEPRALALARERVTKADFLEADLETGECAALTNLAGRADVVLCSEVLEHLAHPQSAVRLARRIVGDRGRLVLTVPAGPVTPFDRFIGHSVHYTLERITGLLSESGFRVTRAYLWGFPFHTVFRMAIGRCPGAVEHYRDDRISVLGRALSAFLYYLFFLNVRSSRLGRQIVAVGEPM